MHQTNQMQFKYPFAKIKQQKNPHSFHNKWGFFQASINCINSKESILIALIQNRTISQAVREGIVGQIILIG